MPLKHSTFRWFKTLACTTVLVGRFHHLNYSMQRTKIADSLLLGTLCGVGHFNALHFQAADIFIKCNYVSIYHYLPNDI